MKEQKQKIQQQIDTQICSKTKRPMFTWKVRRHLHASIFSSCFGAVGLFSLFLFLAGTGSADAFNKKSIVRLKETKICLRCNLRSADLSQKDLAGSKLTGAYLIRANLRGANLANANLVGARLVNANLREANLRKANLSSSLLVRSNLKGADLRGSDLRNARLSRAVLTQSDMKDANLKGAQLQDAKLDGVRGLTQKQLSKACGDAHTVLPSGFTIPTCLPEHR